MTKCQYGFYTCEFIGNKDFCNSCDGGQNYQMKEDKRKNNGGARPGTGPKPKLPGERKVQVQFSIKEKHVEKARKQLQSLVDKINSK